jgi:hypothetical protein
MNKPRPKNETQESNDFSVELVTKIIQNLTTDTKINLNVKWFKQLIDTIKPLYTKLSEDSDAITNERISELIEILIKHEISKNIKDLFNDDMSKLDISSISELTNLVTNMAASYNDINKLKNTNITQSDVMTLLTIVLYTIMFCIKKDKFDDVKDAKWIKVTIDCLTLSCEFIPKKKVNCNCKCLPWH